MNDVERIKYYKRLLGEIVPVVEQAQKLKTSEKDLMIKLKELTGLEFENLEDMKRQIMLGSLEI